VAAAASMLVLANLALVGAAQAGIVRIGETLAFDRAWAAEAHELHAWFGNPFSYPANLVFALANGVSPADYDILRTNRFLSDPLRPYGRIDIGTADEGFLADGWYGPEREQVISYRWAAKEAEIRVPLDRAAPIRIDVRLHAFNFPGAAAQNLMIRANRARCAPLTVGGDWQTAQCVLDRSAWRPGVNRIVLAFSRADRPMDVGMGPDGRFLSAAVDYIRVTEVQ
jgi:hypothetical protein